MSGPYHNLSTILSLLALKDDLDLQPQKAVVGHVSNIEFRTGQFEYNSGINNGLEQSVNLHSAPVWTIFLRFPVSQATFAAFRQVNKPGRHRFNLRIAVNTRFLLPDKLEGFGWYTHEIMRRMVRAHPEDDFVFLFDRPYHPSFVYAVNVTPVVLSPRARFALQFLAWFEWAVPRALKKYKADVFFSPDSMCSLSGKTPTVMTCHDLVPLHFPQQVPWLHRHFLQFFLPRFLRRAERVLTVSEFVRQDIAQTCQIPPTKISTVYNGCREVFTPLDEPEKQKVRDAFSAGEPYFFYTGAIHPRKNIQRLIRAFDLFKTKTGASAKLLLAGRFAWQTNEITKAYEEAQHRDDIHFLGYVTEQDLAKLTAAATALAYVSLSEGFGLPMLEAMNCDTPVLAARATCLPEIAGEAALFVDPLSETAIAEGLELLWQDPAFAEQLVERGRLQRGKFSWDVAAELVYQALQEVVGSHNGTTAQR